MARGGTEKFQQDFCEGKLGNKTQYGNRWVVECDNCDILMARIEGEDRILAINFGDNITVGDNGPLKYGGSGKLLLPDCLIKYRINKNIDKVGDITKSGLLEKRKIYSSSSSLSSWSLIIKIGEKNFAYDTVQRIKPQTVPEFIDNIEADFYNKSYASLREIPYDIKSIVEYRTHRLPIEVKENILNSIFLDNNWFVPMPEGFEPEGSRKQYLFGKPNPLQYGLVGSEFIYNPESLFMEVNFDKLSDKYGTTIALNIESWKTDLKTWYQTKKDLKSDSDKLEMGSSFHYNLSGGKDIMSDIKIRDGNIYVKGVYRSTFWGEPVLILDKWHKKINV